MKNLECSVDSCEKRAATRGLCHAHYDKFKKYGDPLAGRTHSGQQLKFIQDVINSQTDECQLWTFGKDRDGYGQVWDGKQRKGFLTHIYVCLLVYGDRPTDKHQVAHSCGVRSCINPRHLRWATKLENESDKILHGTRARGIKHGKAKLNENDVINIRKRISNGEIQAELGRLYQISPSTVRDIKSRKIWSFID